MPNRAEQSTEPERGSRAPRPRAGPGGQGMGCVMRCSFWRRRPHGRSSRCLGTQVAVPQLSRAPPAPDQLDGHVDERRSVRADDDDPHTPVRDGFPDPCAHARVRHGEEFDRSRRRDACDQGRDLAATPCARAASASESSPATRSAMACASGPQRSRACRRRWRRWRRPEPGRGALSEHDHDGGAVVLEKMKSGVEVGVGHGGDVGTRAVGHVPRA